MHRWQLQVPIRHTCLYYVFKLPDCSVPRYYTGQLMSRRHMLLRLLGWFQPWKWRHFTTGRKNTENENLTPTAVKPLNPTLRVGYCRKFRWCTVFWLLCDLTHCLTVVGQNFEWLRKKTDLHRNYYIQRFYLVERGAAVDIMYLDFILM